MANAPPPHQAAPTQAPQGPPPYRQIAAAHIRELSTINESIPSILRTGAISISHLTNTPIAPPPSYQIPANVPDSPAMRQAILSKSSHALFTAILQTKEQLHAQIDALQAESVIPAEQTRYIAPVQREGQRAEERVRDPEASVTNGGLGDLDVGVLNARAGVRQAGGDEVLTRVTGVLEELVRKVEEGEGLDMVVDG